MVRLRTVRLHASCSREHRLVKGAYVEILKEYQPQHATVSNSHASGVREFYRNKQIKQRQRICPPDDYQVHRNLYI